MADLVAGAFGPPAQTPGHRMAVAFGWTSAAVAFAGTVVALAVAQDAVSYEAIFTDAVQFANLHPLVGMVSLLGLFLWAAAAGIAFQTWALVRLRPGGTYASRFVLATGLFTTVLLLDDGFMLHETVLPALGIREAAVKAAYIGLVALYAVAFRTAFLHRNRTLSMAAWACLGGSLVADSTLVFRTLDLERNAAFMFAFEDGLKLTGITLWLAFVAKTSGDLLRPGR